MSDVMSYVTWGGIEWPKGKLEEGGAIFELHEDFTLPYSGFTIAKNMQLNIKPGKTLTIPDGGTLTNNGSLVLAAYFEESIGQAGSQGKVNNNGTINNNSTTRGTPEGQTIHIGGIQVMNGMLTNSGRINNNYAGTISIGWDGTINNDNGTIANNFKGTINNLGTIKNNKLIYIYGPTTGNAPLNALSDIGGNVIPSSAWGRSATQIVKFYSDAVTLEPGHGDPPMDTVNAASILGAIQKESNYSAASILEKSDEVGGMSAMRAATILAWDTEAFGWDQWHYVDAETVLRDVSVQRSASILTAMTAISDIRIDGLGVASRILAGMAGSRDDTGTWQHSVEVMDAIAAASVQTAASIFKIMATYTGSYAAATTIINAIDDKAAAAILASMVPDHTAKAAAILSAMATTKAAGILAASENPVKAIISTDKASGILAAMTDTAKAAAILAAMTDTAKAAAIQENLKYNNFLNTAYTVDFNSSSFTLLLDSNTVTNFNQNTTIIKKIFDASGVVFTPSAWAQVKNYIFNVNSNQSISVNNVNKVEPTSENQKYNKFFNAAYKLDFNGTSFTWSSSSDTSVTTLTKDIEIIKPLFNDDGVIFTPSAWTKVKDYIFKNI